MKINVVCNDSGWIYDRFIEAFKKHSRHKIIRNSKRPADVTHYIPYYEVPKAAQLSSKTTAWFSHQEVTNKALHNKFLSAGTLVDCAISQSAKYMRVLQQNGAQWVEQVMPGVDLDQFTLDKAIYPDKEKMVVGYVGREYSSSNRKNPQLLSAIAKMPHIEFITTGGKLKLADIPNFYGKIDLLVSPALVEGGPMCIQESLAMGKPVLCYDDVGVANEFKMGVITVPFNNSNMFLRTINEIRLNKIYRTWYNDRMAQETRAQVEKYTWEKFVEAHDEIWEKLCP